MRSLILGAAVAAMLALPVAAQAQQNPNGWYDQNGQWHQRVDNRNGDRRDQRDERNQRDRDDRDRAERNRYNNGNGNGYGYGRRNNGSYDNEGYNRGYGNGGYNRGYGNGGRLGGTISSFGGYNLSLGNGPAVHLHNGTVINPTGTTLQPGMRVQIIGHPNNDGSFEADTINVIGNGNTGYTNGGYWGR